jgi:hypothetical protein
VEEERLAGHPRQCRGGSRERRARLFRAACGLLVVAWSAAAHAQEYMRDEEPAPKSVEEISSPIGFAALVLFILGLMSTFAGLCLVLGELRVSLDVIEFEHENLRRLGQGGGLLPPDLESSGNDEHEGGIP